MTPTSKATISGLLSSALADAKDNLNRARHQFDPGQRNIDVEYGSSGKTCRQILREYEDRHHALTMAFVEVRALP